MNHLTQSKNFVKREFRFTDSKLFLNVIKFGNSDEIDIRFETIEGEKVSFTNSNAAFRGIGFFCGFIGLISLVISGFNKSLDTAYVSAIWFSIGTILYVLYLLSRETIWKIKLNNNSYVQIHKKIPNEKEVNDFIAALIKARNKYLVENYFMVDENLDYESQLERFKWLKDISAISKSDFEEKYTELKETVKPKQANIGFGN